MASQADRLLIGADLICKNHNLCRNPAFIDAASFQKLFHLIFQFRPVFFHDLRGTFFNLIDQRYHIVQLAKQILLQILTLACACLDKFLCRLADRLFENLPHMLLVLRRLLHRKDLRTPCKTHHRRVIRNPKLVRHLTEIIHILASQGTIVL